jgi:hypothetical protein
MKKGTIIGAFTNTKRKKMGRKIQIRFYRVQDKDLFTLLFDPSIDLKVIVNKVLGAYARHEPAPIFYTDYDFSKKGKNGSEEIHYKYSERRVINLVDNDAINLLEYKVRKKDWNNLIKYVLRKSIRGTQNVFMNEEYKTEFINDYFGADDNEVDAIDNLEILPVITPEEQDENDNLRKSIPQVVQEKEVQEKIEIDVGTDTEAYSDEYEEAEEPDAFVKAFMGLVM